MPKQRAMHCYDCGADATHTRLWQDECPTDRGVEIRNGYEWVCNECDSSAPKFWENDKMNCGHPRTNDDYCPYCEARADRLADAIERILFRRALEKKLEGYTLEVAREIAVAILKLA